jgi:lipopolysaccharide export system protein LptA
MLREKLPAIGRVLSLLILIGTIAVIVTAFIRARRQPRPPGPVRAASILKANVTSVVEGYKFVKMENGRETMRLLAAKDTAYEDGRHELEKVDLTALGENPGSSMRILADRGYYLHDQSVVTFDGNVKVTNSEGLEVMTQSLRYEQQTEIASTEVAIQFRKGEISGSSVGAQLHTKTHHLTLIKDARVRSTSTKIGDTGSKAGPNAGINRGQPVDITSEKASYAEIEGVIRFEGNATAMQGERSARADTITGVINTGTKKLDRIELRGNSSLKSQEKDKASEAHARDMDFLYDEFQHLKSSVANGAAHARSLEKDSPREINAERIETTYRPGGPGESESLLSTMTTQGRTTMKIEVLEGAPHAAQCSERVLEGDSVQAFFREDGKNLARAEANGNAILTVTPKQITPTAERKRLRAPKFTAEFFETGNLIKAFAADGNAVAEFEPIEPPNQGAKDAKGKDVKSKERTKKTLSGKKLTANFDQQTQDVAEMVVDGDAKYTDGDLNATAVRGTYTATNRTVAMRGKPLLWDTASRTNADEIDTNIDTDESFLRGRVRTTYFSRDTTGGAAPFKEKKAPVTVTADQATVKHNEGAARYVGNVRSWQDDDFVRADNMELDRGERLMNAWGNAQSAFYDFEREIEKGRKEVVPVFAQADRITYNDETRIAHYEGSVKIRQGTDRIDSVTADVLLDENKRLVQMTASKDVVMTQPNRRATGDQVVYTAATDTAVLTGNLAVVEDREREAITKSSKLTMHLHDARIEANEESGSKKRVKTTHRIQK